MSEHRQCRTLFSIAFMGCMALFAGTTGVALILFPELGALSHDVFTRPGGRWARSPVHLVLTPLLAAVLGILVTRALPYGPWTIVLDVLATTSLISLTRSPVAPSISAGLLPLVLGITSWRYPLAITLGTSLLTGLSATHRFAMQRSAGSAPHTGDHDRVDDVLESAPSTFTWVPAFFAVVLLLSLLAVATGERFVLFPPLVVIGFEMFAHPLECPWADRSWALPVACAGSALAGVASVWLLGPGVLAAVASMSVGVVLLRRLSLHAPPVLAVGMLPLIMPHAGAAFVGAVLTGTIVTTLAFKAWRRWLWNARRLCD